MGVRVTLKLLTPPPLLEWKRKIYSSIWGSILSRFSLWGGGGGSTIFLNRLNQDRKNAKGGVNNFRVTPALTKFFFTGKKWDRGLIVERHPESAHLFYLDRGTFAHVKLKEMVFMKKKWLKAPRMALCVELEGKNPSGLFLVFFWSSSGLLLAFFWPFSDQILIVLEVQFKK